MSAFRLALFSLTVMLSASCTGRIISTSDHHQTELPDAGFPTDTEISLAIDAESPVDTVDRACSSTGIAARCDPIAGNGCGPTAGCYLAKGVGPACACPVGQNQAGAACNTSTECAPTHVCAGTQAPGTCRPMCDPNAPTCATDILCRAIEGYPNLGFCDG